MAATVAHCQQLIDKLRVLSVSDDAAKMEQVRLRARSRNAIWERSGDNMLRRKKLSGSSRLR